MGNAKYIKSWPANFEKQSLWHLGKSIYLINKVLKTINAGVALIDNGG